MSITYNYGIQLVMMVINYLKMKKTSDLKFFIVDDDPFYRMLYNQHLLNMGFRNNTLIENGEDCLNMLYLEPDVIFLDYDMQTSNGLEILQQIKLTHPNIYLLLISGQRNIKVAVKALKHGAFDYIVKGDEDLDMISDVIKKISATKVPVSKLMELN